MAKKPKSKKRRPSDCRQKSCHGKYKLTYSSNAPIFTCDKCGDQDLTWEKFYNEYLQLFKTKENWDNKKDQVSCVIGFFRYMYEEFYNTKYIFVPQNRNPYSCKEVKDTWKLLSAFDGDSHEARRYLFWLFKRGINKNTTIIHFGYVNTPGLIRKYNLYAKRKHILRRESSLPKTFIDWCKEYAVQIFDDYELVTMNDLGALLVYAQHYDVSGIEGTVLTQAKEIGLIKDSKLNIG